MNSWMKSSQRASKWPAAARKRGAAFPRYLPAEVLGLYGEGKRNANPRPVSRKSRPLRPKRNAEAVKRGSLAKHGFSRRGPEGSKTTSSSSESTAKPGRGEGVQRSY